MKKDILQQGGLEAGKPSHKQSELSQWQHHEDSMINCAVLLLPLYEMAT